MLYLIMILLPSSSRSTSSATGTFPRNNRTRLAIFGGNARVSKGPGAGAQSLGRGAVPVRQSVGFAAGTVTAAVTRRRLTWLGSQADLARNEGRAHHAIEYGPGPFNVHMRRLVARVQLGRMCHSRDTPRFLTCGAVIGRAASGPRYAPRGTSLARHAHMAPCSCESPDGSIAGSVGPVHYADGALF
jgi:hypothetical protein